VIDLYINNLIKDEAGLKAGKGKSIQIKAEGHAGFGSKGNDIVCAAASAVIQTAIVSVSRVALVQQNVKQKQGFLQSVISIDKLETKKLENLLIILDTMLTGLDEIIRQYPEALRINFK
jgi:uncharacterized protein